MRWETVLGFSGGRYRFTTSTDDGVRLYVDDRRVINNWWPMRGYRSVILDLAEGSKTKWNTLKGGESL